MFLFTGKEALIFNKNSLIIADTHIGIEKELLLRGLSVPFEHTKIIKKIEEITNNFDKKLKELVILGDFKHNVPKISYIELQEVPKVLLKLSEMFDRIIITKGNHDGNLEQLIPKEIENKIIICDFYRKKGICFTHGHKKDRKKCKVLAIGHNHPLARITSEIGESFYEKVFIKGKTQDGKIVYIFPAFSNLAGGWEVGEFQGPIAKNIIKYQVYTLNGILISENERDT